MSGHLALPIIRLELEGVRYQVMHALATHNQEIEARVAESVKQAIDGFDIRAEVERITVQELRKSIESAVQSAIWSVFRDKRIKDALGTAVQEVLRSGVTE